MGRSNAPSQPPGELNERMAGPRARVAKRPAAEDAATEILDSSGAERWINVTVTETIEERFRQEKRGRPGDDTRHRKLTRTRFQLTITIDAEAVRYDAASDGCFPLITNDQDPTNAEVLIAYRYQPNLEKRHHQLKSVQDAAPVTLKSPARIEALFACQFIALLCCCLIERELRGALTREQITDLPLYPQRPLLHRANRRPRLRPPPPTPPPPPHSRQPHNPGLRG